MSVSKLKIVYKEKDLVNISFNIKNSLALIGQSGSGKSLTIKALLGMLPQGMELELNEHFGFNLVRGESVAFVPQNPFTALSPLTKIKKQFFAKKERVETLFNAVGLDKALLERFAPELSGGQLQRVIIAMALERYPKLLLLDEPTTALDPKTKKNIIELLKKLQIEEKFKMLFVTHDIASAQNLCEDVCIIKDGLVVESGNLKTVLSNPTQKYTKTLIEANFANRKYRK